jgi:hypothetical protein
MEWSSDTNLTQLCLKCQASNCYTCRDSTTCSSCQYGYYLDSGACIARTSASLVLDLTVHGDRSTPSLLQAIQQAYVLSHAYNDATVTITLASSEIHVITLDDFIAYGQIDDYLTLFPQFKLTIK